MDEATGQSKVLGKVMGSRGRRGYRIHRDHINAGGHDPEPCRSIAIQDNRRFQVILFGNRNIELVVYVLAREGVAGVEQIMVGLDDLFALLFEDLRDLVFRDVGIAVINAAEHPEHEHVLALAGISYDFETLFLDRQFEDDQSLLVKIGERFPVLGTDYLVRILGPHVFQQDDRAFPVRMVGNT